MLLQATKVHGAWPHGGPGNSSPKEGRYGLLFVYGNDERSQRHTTGERVFQGAAMLNNDCYDYENPVGEEKLAFSAGLTVAELRTVSRVAALVEEAQQQGAAEVLALLASGEGSTASAGPERPEVQMTLVTEEDVNRTTAQNID
jgi:hypothetical protein